MSKLIFYFLNCLLDVVDFILKILIFWRWFSKKEEPKEQYYDEGESTFLLNDEITPPGIFLIYFDNFIKGLLTDEEIKKILDKAELNYNEEMLRKRELMSEQGIEIC